MYIASDKSKASYSSVTVSANAKGIFSLTPYLDPNQYFKPNLLGGSIEYDVYLGSVGCICVATMQLVAMPGRDSSGNLWNTDGYYYCDSKKSNFNYCPEFDVMEANMWVWQSTAHTCNASTDNGFFAQCDKKGPCIQNTVGQLSYYDYGPSDHSKIYTGNDIHVKLDFNVDDAGQFKSFVVTLSQDKNTVMMEGNCETNAYLSEYLSGNMAVVLNSYTTYDNWLTKDYCQFDYCTNPYLSFKNFQFKTAAARSKALLETDLPKEDYAFGMACEDQQADFCNGHCDCRKSWPVIDPNELASADAHCRCMESNQE
jgi:hypothetical protein